MVDTASPLAFLQNEAVESVLMWENPITSGVTLAIVSVAFFLLEKSGFTLVSLLANFLLVAVITIFTWSNVATVFNLPPPPLKTLEVDEEQARLLVAKITSTVNSVLSSIFSIILGKDAASTLKLAGTLYIIGKVGSYFHSATLLYLIIVMFFTVPKVYVLKKKEIDEIIAIVLEQANTHYTLLKGIVLEKVKALKPKTKSSSEVEAKKSK